MAQLTRAELAAVPPSGVTAYLVSVGWQQVYRDEYASAWSRAGVPDEVEVPLNGTLRDYPARIAELIAVLSEIESRPKRAVLADMLAPLVDRQVIRIMPETPTGTLGLHDAALALEGVRELYLAAASSLALNGAPPVLPKRKPEQAWEFVRGVRLGQTAVGSYVLRVETPIVDESRAPLASRSVLTHLHAAASATLRMADNNADVANARAADGISANLCEGLMGIGGANANPFSLSFSWSSTSPVDPATPDLTFGRESIAWLKKAGKRLRQLPLSEKAVVQGRVVEMRRVMPKSAGEVVIEGSVQMGDQVINEKITMWLAPPDYAKAIAANLNGQVLRAEGVRWLVGHQSELRGVKNIEPVTK